MGTDLPLVHALWEWGVLGFLADRDPVDSDRGVLVVEDVVGAVVDVGGVAYLLGAENILVRKFSCCFFFMVFGHSEEGD